MIKVPDKKRKYEKPEEKVENIKINTIITSDG